jgi:hypothetical protein
VASCCEHTNEPSGLLHYGEYLGWVRNCQLLKKDFTPRSWLVRGDQLQLQLQLKCLCQASCFSTVT